MKKLNTKGFGVVEAILIVIILGIISGAGYMVYNSQKKTNQSLDNANSSLQSASESNKENTEKQSEDKKETDISSGWKRYESGRGAFSIKIADGMNGLNDTSSNMIVVRSYTQGGQTEVKEIDGYGSDAFSVVSIYQADTSNIYEPSEKVNLKEEQFSTTSGISGTKRSFEDPYIPPCEGIGCYVGTKYAYYDFENKKSGKTVRVAYSQRVLNDETKKIYNITNDDPDITKIIDSMVKTLEIK